MALRLLREALEAHPAMAKAEMKVPRWGQGETYGSADVLPSNQRLQRTRHTTYLSSI
jgi:hypothetical protein